MTMTLISTVTAGSGGAASFDFTSIPQTYTDLFILVSNRTSNTGGLGWYDYALTFNDTTGSYSNKFLYGSGSNAASASDSSTSLIVRTAGSSNTANTFGNTSFYIPNYTGSTYKSVSYDSVSENNGGSSIQILTAGLWSNTAAITTVSLDALGGGTFDQYSTASLYGILKGSGGASVS